MLGPNVGDKVSWNDMSMGDGSVVPAGTGVIIGRTNYSEFITIDGGGLTHANSEDLTVIKGDQ